MENLKRVFTDEKNRTIPILIWVILIISFFININNVEVKSSIVFLAILNSVFLVKEGNYQFVKLSCAFLILFALVFLLLF